MTSARISHTQVDAPHGVSIVSDLGGGGALLGVQLLEVGTLEWGAPTCHHTVLIYSNASHSWRSFNTFQLSFLKTCSVSVSC